MSLREKLMKAIGAFNEISERQLPDYSSIKEYLAPYAVMTKIDDATIVRGTPDELINYFNESQVKTKRWPRLIYDPAKMHEDPGKSVVTGTAIYRDKGDDASTAIPCTYRYHFTPDGKIDVATTIPI